MNPSPLINSGLFWQTHDKAPAVALPSSWELLAGELIRSFDEPADAALTIGEVGTRHAIVQLVGDAAVDHLTWLSARYRTNVGSVPNEGITLRRDDPGRQIVEADLPILSIRELDTVIWRLWTGVCHGDHQQLCLTFVRPNGTR